MSDVTIINIRQCQKVAGVLRNHPVKSSFYSRPFVASGLPHETKLRMLFYAVVICHQTRNLYSKKHDLHGWDFIEFAFLKISTKNPDLIDPSYLEVSDSRILEKMLLEAFSDSGKAEDSTLDRIEERVRLMVNFSKWITIQFKGSFNTLLHNTNGKLFSQGKGFYEVLEQTEAFSDPLRKKSSFLLKLLFDASLFSLTDTSQYVPIMDYHMQRVLLRLGCIEIADSSLLSIIRSKTALKTDEPIRSACIDAIRLIANFSGYEVWVMNDYFWPLGRSCCNETLACIDNVCSKNPCTFVELVADAIQQKCSFENVCAGARKPDTRSIWEPMVETHYY